MSDYKLVPVVPTAEMAEAAKDAYMPFGDMNTAIMMAVLAAPAVQGEVGEGVPDYINDAIDNLAHANYELSYSGYQERTRDVELIRAYVARAAQPAEQQPIPSSLAYDASIHLTNWLNMNLCECEGGHICGYTEVRRTRDALLEAAEQQPAPDMEALVEAASAALDEIEAIMHEAYNGAEPVCCGGFGAEGCCGSPEPEWSEFDQNTMDRLAPHQRALTAALAAHRQQGGDEP